MLPCDLVQYRVCFSSRPRSCRCAGATWPLGVSCGLPGVTGVYRVPCVLVGLCISSWGLWVIRLCRQCGGPPHKHPNRSADTPRGVIGGLSKVAGCPGDLCVKSGMEGGVGWRLRGPWALGQGPTLAGSWPPSPKQPRGREVCGFESVAGFPFYKEDFQNTRVTARSEGSQVEGGAGPVPEALRMWFRGGSGPGKVCSSQVTEPAQRGW